MTRVRLREKPPIAMHFGDMGLVAYGPRKAISRRKLERPISVVGELADWYRAP